MNVEIVKFYKNKNLNPKDKYLGSLHVRVKNDSFQFDLRGILVIKESKHFFFKIPSNWAIDEDSNQKVWYPILNFGDKELQKDFIDQIKSKGQRYIEEKENLQTPEKPKIEPVIEKIKPQSAKGPKVIKPISAREWQDFSTYKSKTTVGVLKNKTHK